MPDTPESRWYPNRSDFQTHEQWDAHVQTLNHVYSVMDRNKELQAQVEELKKAKPSNIGQPPGGAMNTKIAGVYVKPGTPANGDTIRYNTASGQFELGP